LNAQEKALVAVGRHLDASGIPYMIIGGMANAVWGVPRATLDVDVTVWTEPVRPSAAWERVAEGFVALPESPAAFADETRVLPMETADGVRVDVVFGLLPFEHQAIERAVARDIGGQPVRFATAEDLILLKILSERERDLDDVSKILARQRGHLDRGYLDPRVEELAQILERPEIRERYLRGLGER
jgi:predicted nucleotidyltransferase